MNIRSAPSLLCIVLCGTVVAQEPAREVQKKEVKLEVATLGATTRAPTKEEVAELGLKFEVRARGQVVATLAKDGVASQSGLNVGDVIVGLGGVEVFSQDDIADVLRVSSPGQKIKASVVGGKTKDERVLEIRLGTQEIKAPKTASLAWDLASLAHLDVALAQAKKANKLVLVGLSGAET